MTPDEQAARRAVILQIATAAVPALIAKQVPIFDESAVETAGGVATLSGPQIAEVTAAAYELGAAFVECLDISEAQHAAELAANNS